MKYFIILFLVLNTFLSAQSYVTIPDKNTTDQFTAAELNQILDAIKDGTLSINTASITVDGIDYTTIATPSDISDSLDLYFETYYNVFSVRKYGAHPDSSANSNGIHIQNAIDAASAAGGTLWWTGGTADTFEVDTTLWFKQNVTYRSDGAWIKAADSMHMGIIESDNQDNITIIDLRIEGNNSMQRSPSWTNDYSAIYIVGCENLQIEKCYIRNTVLSAIRIDSSNNCMVNYNTVFNAKYAPIYVSWSDGARITFNSIDNTTMTNDWRAPTMISTIESQHPIIMGNTVEMTDLIDVTINSTNSGAGILTQDDGGGHPSAYPIVIGNYIDAGNDSLNIGYTNGGSERIILMGNAIHGAYYIGGIELSYTSHNAIIGNIMDSCVVGIQQSNASVYNALVGNIISNTQKYTGEAVAPAVAWQLGGGNPIGHTAVVANCFDNNERTLHGAGAPSLTTIMANVMDTTTWGINVNVGSGLIDQMILIGNVGADNDHDLVITGEVSDWNMIGNMFINASSYSTVPADTDLVILGNQGFDTPSTRVDLFDGDMVIRQSLHVYDSTKVGAVGDWFWKMNFDTSIDSLDIITGLDTLRIPFREMSK